MLSRRSAQLAPPVLLAMLALSAAAYASGSSVKFKAPPSVRVGQSFKVSVSGYDSGGNNLVVFGVPGDDGGPQSCAATLSGELNRFSALHSGQVASWSIADHKRFLKTEHLVAARSSSDLPTTRAGEPGKHTLCAYVDKAVSMEQPVTLAHATVHYTVRG